MRRIAAAGLLAILALTGCSSPPEAKTAVVSADAITFNDGAGGPPTVVSFDLPPAEFSAALTDVLGEPTQTREPDPGADDWENLTWGGLGMFRGFGDVAPSAIYADAAQIRGFVLTTAGGYQVGQPFPSQGAEASCALGDRRRFNTLPDSSGGRSVTLRTGADARGTDTDLIGAFSAPTFVQGC